MLTAPDQYTLLLPTEQAQQLLTHPAELDQVNPAHWKTAACQSGIVFASEPMLRVVADPQSTEIKVLVEYQPGWDGRFTHHRSGWQAGWHRARQAWGGCRRHF